MSPTRLVLAVSVALGPAAAGAALAGPALARAAGVGAAGVGAAGVGAAGVGPAGARPGFAHVAVVKHTPVLNGAGRRPGSAGFGEARPNEIYRGGDQTGLMCHIHWDTWGGTFAIGTGTAWYAEPHKPASSGHWAPAVVVLYRHGSWRHRPAYMRYRWYFPQGGSLSGGHAIDCLT